MSEDGGYLSDCLLEGGTLVDVLLRDTDLHLQGLGDALV